MFLFPLLPLKDWGSQQKKANRSSEKNKKKLGGEAETRLTNDISPESTPGMGRRKTRTPHSFPHARYMTQMSVPEQAELERLKQRINFSDLDQVCVNRILAATINVTTKFIQLSLNNLTDE